MNADGKAITTMKTCNFSTTRHTYSKYQVEVKTTAVDKTNLQICKHMYHYTKAPLIRASMHESIIFAWECMHARSTYSLSVHLPDSYRYTLLTLLHTRHTGIPSFLLCWLPRTRCCGLFCIPIFRERIASNFLAVLPMNVRGIKLDDCNIYWYQSVSGCRREEGDKNICKRGVLSEDADAIVVDIAAECCYWRSLW